VTRNGIALGGLEEICWDLSIFFLGAATRLESCICSPATRVRPLLERLHAEFNPATKRFAGIWGGMYFQM